MGPLKSGGASSRVQHEVERCPLKMVAELSGAKEDKLTDFFINGRR